MKCVVQRVKNATVAVDGQIVSSIGPGLLVLAGIAVTDTVAEVNWMASKLPVLRVFPDETGAMNRSLADIGGGLLVVSQFTLYGDLVKGTRPSFMKAARPDHAEPLYNLLLETLKSTTDIDIQSGQFGAMMDVSLVNDGPVTMLLER